MTRAQVAYRRLVRVSLTFLLFMLSVPQAIPAQAEPVEPVAPCAACVTWEATPTQAAGLLARPEPVTGLDLVVRLEGEGMAALLSRFAERNARAGLILSATDVLAPELSRLAATVLVQVEATDDPDALAYALKRLFTEARAHNPAAVLGLEAPAETLAALQQRGLAAYVDFVVGPAGGREGLEGFASVRVRAEASPKGSVDDVLTLTAQAQGQRMLMQLPPGAPGETIALAVARLSEVLPAGLTPLREVGIECEGGSPQPIPCETHVFLHPETLDAIALVEARGPVQAVVVRPGAERIVWHPVDAALGGSSSGPLSLRPPGPAARAELPGMTGEFVLRISGWSGMGQGRFASDVTVVGKRSLSVEEVIARHQAAAARQAREIRSLIASGNMVLTFQAPGLAAPMTVTAETIVYTAGGLTEIEQRRVRLNGIDDVASRDGVPRLPILEPERVSAIPLAIALTEAYRYRLEGRKAESGRDCYVVGFEPRDESRPLFRGSAWIASDGFALVRVAATQTGLRGPIVSSAQDDLFRPLSLDGRSLWLLARSEVHQVYEGPGHRTPIHRVLTLDRHEVNSTGFWVRLETAHAGGSVMLRDTPEGFRYLRKSAAGSVPGNSPGSGAESQPEAAGRVQAGSAGPPFRVLAGKAQRVRTLAGGLLFDPNIDRPLPFAGLSYVDFDFLETGAQVSAFLAPAFAQAAWSVPSLRGSRWQLHGAGFGTLVEYNDRAFRQGLERFEENLRQRSARLSLGLLRPLGATTRLRARYELEYTHLERAESTAPDFVVPLSPLVHGLRLSLEAQRGPWTSSLWWNPARRQRWRPWGRPEAAELSAKARGFQRFGVSVSRSFVLSRRSVARIEGQWMAGRELDRFSRFTFDNFENRLRGYPSASLRFDHGGLLRSVVTWNPAPRLRLEAFLDTARVRDPGFGPASRSYTGVGAGAEMPAPWGLLLSLEWGYGFQAVGRDGERGTQVVRMTGYKVF